MNWREAFLAQARSDAAIRVLLNREGCEYSHQLHYLQMMTEKLAKGLMANGNAPPPKTHAGLVACLRYVQLNRSFRNRLRYKDAKSFGAFIKSLLPLAEQIQRLAPSYTGFSQPNPEYPWQPKVDDEVVCPASFSFPVFNPKQMHMVRLVRLVEDLLQIAT